jgi:hypothetical protein
VLASNRANISQVNQKKEIDMEPKNSVAAIYDTHEQAEKAVKELQEAGVDMKSLSVVGLLHR